MSSGSDEAAREETRRRVKSVSHDLGNLSYRLTFLAENLKSQISEPAQRAEALALLEDTTAKIGQAIERLRGIEKDV